jgi:hypothetical protein
MTLASRSVPGDVQETRRIAVRDSHRRKRSFAASVHYSQSARGDVYYFIERNLDDDDRPFGKPHAIYDRDGNRHIRSSGWKHLPSKAPRPDRSFHGILNVFSESFPTGQIGRADVPCDPADYDDVFVIDASAIEPDADHALVVDLIASGSAGTTGPWREVVASKIFKTAFPWVLVTLWKGL